MFKNKKISTIVATEKDVIMNTMIKNTKKLITILIITVLIILSAILILDGKKFPFLKKITWLKEKEIKISLEKTEIKKEFPPEYYLNFPDTKLKKGSTGKEVELLQMILSWEPELYPEQKITGIFDSATEQAVKNFQCRQNIICKGMPEITDWGIVDEKTREEIEKNYYPIEITE